MRTFVALELPQGFATDVAALTRQLSAAVEGRFLPRDFYHLTLAFLGDGSANDIAAATDALEAACASQPAVPLRSDGLGKFGRASDATLWLGIAPVPELMELAERVRGELAIRGVPFDDKPFKPHITLARRARSEGKPASLAFRSTTRQPASLCSKAPSSAPAQPTSHCTRRLSG